MKLKCGFGPYLEALRRWDRLVARWRSAVAGTLAAIDTALGAGLTYTPNAYYSGTDAVDLLAVDAGSGTSSGTTALYVTVATPTTPSIQAPSSATVGTSNSLVFNATNGN